MMLTSTRSLASCAANFPTDRPRHQARRARTKDDPPDWELISPAGVVLEFGPGVRWQISGADDPPPRVAERLDLVRNWQRPLQTEVHDSAERSRPPVAHASQTAAAQERSAWKSVMPTSSSQVGRVRPGRRRWQGKGGDGDRLLRRSAVVRRLWTIYPQYALAGRALLLCFFAPAGRFCGLALGLFYPCPASNRRSARRASVRPAEQRPAERVRVGVREGATLASRDECTLVLRDARARSLTQRTDVRLDAVAAAANSSVRRHQTATVASDVGGVDTF